MTNGPIDKSNSGEFDTLGVGPRGPKGEKGDTGDTGIQGTTSPELSSLALSMQTLSDAMTTLANSTEALAVNFKESVLTNAKRLASSLRLTILGCCLVFLVIIGLIFVGFGQSKIESTTTTIHNAQVTNSAILQLVKNQSAIIANVTNPNSSYSQANSKSVINLLNSEAACLANHGDRSRELLAHVKVDPLRAGCNLNGTVNNG